MNSTRLALGVVALVLGAAYYFDLPSEIEAAQDAAATYRANRAEQIDRENWEKAVQAMCGGENSAWKLLENGSIQCFTHKGFKTKQVTL